MPTQIQGLVSPVYEPIITVPATSEVITEAGLTDTALALANRIEFVRDLISSEQDDPQRTALVRDDFFGAILDSAASRLDADFPWRTSESGSPSVNHHNGNAKNPGQVRVVLPGTPNESEFEFHLGSATTLPFNYVTIDHATFVVKVIEDPANLIEVTRFGLGSNMSLLNGGDEAIIVARSRSIDAADWIVIRRNGGVQTTTLNVLPFVSDEFVVWQFVRDTVTDDIDILANGTVVHTVASGDVPAGGCNIGVMGVTTVAETQPHEFHVDMIVARASGSLGPTGTRAGA